MTTTKTTKTAKTAAANQELRINLSSAINEKLSQAQALLSLAAACDSNAAKDGAPKIVMMAALDIVDDAVASLSITYCHLLDAKTVSDTCGRLTTARAIISAGMLVDPKAISDDARQLASDAAINFLQEAMERIEREVWP